MKSRTLRAAFGARYLAALAGFALLACTGPAGSSSSKVSISLPEKISGSKNVAQNLNGKIGSLEVAFDAQLQHAVINVTGGGISSPILLSWDYNNGGSASPAPAAFSVDVPRGSSRLVQVLGVYATTDAATGKSSMQFYYGDTTMTVEGTTADVDIKISQVGAGTSLVSGNIIGRWLDTSGNGPTGSLNVKFAPPGKPSMLIGTSPIIGGWFRTFGLKDTAFSYELADGTSLFGGPRALSSFQPSGNIMTLGFPASFRSQSGNSAGNAAVTWEQQDPQILVLGFFGPGGAGKTACYDGANPYTFSTYAASKAPPSNYLTFPSGNATTGVSVLGGVGSLASCTGVPFQDSLSYVPALMDRNGFDGAAGMASPYQYVNGSQVTITATTVSGVPSGQVQLSWKYLPGAQAVVDRTKIYYLSQSEQSRYYNSNHDLSCNLLAARAPLTEVTGTSANAQVSISQNNNNSFFALCSYRGATAYDSAVQGYVSYGSSEPPTELRVTRNAQMSTAPGALVGSCQQLNVGLYDANGNQTNYFAPIRYKLTDSGAPANGGPATLYVTAADCGSALNPIVLPADSTLTVNAYPNLFYRVGGASGDVHLLNVVYASTNPALTTNSISFVSRTSTDNYLTVNGLPSKVVAGSCYTLNVNSNSYANFQSIVIGTTTIVSLTGPGQVQFYPTSVCTPGAEVTTTSISSVSSNSGPIYAKFSSAFAGNATITATATGLDAGTQTVMSSQMGPTAAALVMTGNSYQRWGDCNFMQVMQVNADGGGLPATADISYALTSTVPGLFFSDDTCTAPIVTGTISSGQLTSSFYFLSGFVSGTGTHTASAAPLANATMTVSLDGPRKLNVSVGGPATRTPSDCVPFTVNAVNANNQAVASQISFPFAISGFPIAAGNVIFSDVACLLPVLPPVIAAGSSTANYYFLADQLNAVATTFNTLAASNASTGTMPGLLGSITLNQRADLFAPNTATMNIAYGYTLNLNFALSAFSGVPPFSFTYQSGTSGPGALTNDSLTAASASATDLVHVTDSSSHNVDLSTTAFSASVVYNFASGSLSGATLNRSSSATYYDASGLLVTASISAPRFEYDSDPATGHPMLGLLLESGASNSLTYSENLSAAVWTSTNASVATDVATAPDGATTADKATASAFGAVANSIGSLTNGYDYTASVFVKKFDTRFVGMKIQAGTVCAGVVADLDVGAVTRMLDVGCSLTAEIGIQKLNSGWYRIWVHSPVLISNGGQLILYPAFTTSTILTGVRNVLATGSTLFWGAQIEGGGSMTSYIPTISTSVNRIGDTATSAPTFAANYGTFRAEWVESRANAPAAYARTVIHAGNASNYHDVSIVNGQVLYSVYYGAAPTFSRISGTLAPGPNKVAVGWDLTTTSAILDLNGTPPLAGTMPSGPNLTSQTLYFGSVGGGAQGLNGYLRKVEYFPVKLDQSSMRSITVP